MSLKTYEFDHAADVATVTKELGPELSRQADEYGLTVTRNGANAFRLHRTGATLHFQVTAAQLQVEVDLAWIACGYHDQIGRGLRSGMPRLLRRCEQQSASSGRDQ